MNQLPANPTLADYQKLVKRLVAERGFDKETPPEVLLLLTEEVGELAKAVRKANGQKTGKHSRHYGVEEEAADVLFMLVDLCNRLDIDLEKAFRAKEEKNRSREWS